MEILAFPAATQFGEFKKTIESNKNSKSLIFTVEERNTAPFTLATSVKAGGFYSPDIACVDTQCRGNLKCFIESRPYNETTF